MMVVVVMVMVAAVCMTAMGWRWTVIDSRPPMGVVVVVMVMV